MKMVIITATAWQWWSPHHGDDDHRRGDEVKLADFDLACEGLFTSPSLQHYQINWFHRCHQQNILIGCYIMTNWPSRPEHRDGWNCRLSCTRGTSHISQRCTTPLPVMYHTSTSHITLVPLVPSSSAISYQANIRCTTKLLVPELVMYHTRMSTSQIGTCVHLTSLKRRTTQYESILIHIYNTGGQRLLWLEEDLWSRVRLVVSRSSPLHPSGWTDTLRGKVFSTSFTEKHNYALLLCPKKNNDSPILNRIEYCD